jgi:CrcB protein
MKSALFVFIGGGAGSIARWAFTKVSFGFNFPMATFTANVLSCLLVGFFSTMLLAKTNWNAELKLILLTGFCGGFSTFSSFISETDQIIKSGNMLLAFGNIIFNIIFCMLALYIGMWLSKHFFNYGII